MPPRHTSPALLIIATLALALAMAACIPPPPTTITPGQPPALYPTPPIANPTPVRGGSLRVLLGQPLRVLNPQNIECRGGCQALGAAVYESLLAPGDRGYPVGVLSTNWETPDQTTYRIRLRQGAKFSDGSAVNAAAVKTSLDAVGAQGSPSPLTDVWRDVVAAVDTPSDGEVLIRLKRPFAPFVSLLASPWTAILAPENMRGLAPRGSGPYQVDFSVTDSARLVRHDGWWRSPPGLLDTIDFDDADPIAIAAALGSGQAQAAFDVLQPVTPPPGGRVLPGPGWSVGLLALNTREGYFADPVARQAVAAAIDRPALMRATGIAAQPWDRLFGPDQWQLQADTPAQAFDVSRARALFDQAGRPGTPLAFPVRDLPATRAAADELAQQLGRLGVPVQVQPVPIGQPPIRLLPGGSPGNMTLVETIPNADAWLGVFWQFGDFNVSGWRSQPFDAALNQAVAARVREEQLPHWQTLAGIVARESPYVVLWSPGGERTSVVGPQVQGLTLRRGPPEWAGVWVQP